MIAFQKYSEEEIACYLDGKGCISDLDFLNAIISDSALNEVVEIVDEIDSVDTIDNVDNVKGIL